MSNRRKIKKDKKETKKEVGDLKVVQQYTEHVSSINQPWREYLCEFCDSELPLVPGFNEQDGVHLWCLGIQCNFKRKLGYNTIEEMKEFLYSEGVLNRFTNL